MEAYITLLTNNNYASGALVLGYSLRASQTTKQLAILITAAVSRHIRERLAAVYDSIIEIGEIDSHSTTNLALLGRPELGITLTKIHVFNQTQYSKVVFLDADTLVLKNIDNLFDTAANGSLEDQDRNKRFAASPDAGWPDCFNSGVFVCKPSFKDYTGLIQMASQEGTFDGGDQGLLNSYFSGWSTGDPNNRLPFIYNTTPTASYSYAPAYQQYRDRLAVVHFIGNFKPWQWLRFADGTVFPRNTSSKDSIELVQQWWNVYDKFVGGKPSDIHDVVHDYDLPPISQWDYIGLDGQPHAPETEKRLHYEGWFQAYDHQNQAQQPPKEDQPGQWLPPIPPRVSERIEWHHSQQHHHHHDSNRHKEYSHQDHQHQHEQHHHAHQNHYNHHHSDQYQSDRHEHHDYEHPQTNYHGDQQHGHHQDGRHEHHHQGHHQDHRQSSHQDYHYHDDHHQNNHHEQHHHEHHEHTHEDHQHHQNHDYKQHQSRHPHQDSGHYEFYQNHEQQHYQQELALPQPPVQQEPHYAYNPHHLTDYHYQPPPLPPVIPPLPEPESQSWYPDNTISSIDERQTHHKLTTNMPKSVEHDINPHHLTDYRYKLPPVVDSPKKASGVANFGSIIPEPIGLPNMYYPNAWDLPMDPKNEPPLLEITPLPIEDTTNKDNTSVPSGKGRPIFPWETAGSTGLAPRAPTRKYYNYAASVEERKRQHELEAAKRLEMEEEALKQIRLQERARYERERVKEEAHEQMTGSQAFENFRLVNAWDVDVGVQMSILQKTEKRRPRSRKSSAGGFRKGYTLEDMLAYEAKQLQEQYEAELIQQRSEEEERWQREQEEARIKEEELRLEKIRLAKIARLHAQERQKKQEESSSYVFRNAWDPPNIDLAKKKIRIEDEDIEFALPLRRDRKSSSSMNFEFAPPTNVPESETQIAKIGGAATIAGIAGATGATVLKAQSGTVRDHNRSAKSEIIDRAVRNNASGAAIIKVEAAALSSNITKANNINTATISRFAGNSSAAETNVASNTAKITTPGSHRFVRTTVSTTITRRKFVNGVEVGSTTTSSTTGGEKMFEIPAGPRSGSYFTGQGRRTVSVSNAHEPSRLTAATTTRTTTTDTSVGTTNLHQTTFSSHSDGTKSMLVEDNTPTHTKDSKSLIANVHKSVLSTDNSSTLHDKPRLSRDSLTIANTYIYSPATVHQTGQHITTAAATTSEMTKTTATTTSSNSIVQESSRTAIRGPDITSLPLQSATSILNLKSENVEQPRRLAGLALQISTNSPTKERGVEEEWALEIEERRRISDLREKTASAAAAAEAMRVLNRYPQATDRYTGRRRADSTSSTKSIGEGVLYAGDSYMYNSSSSSAFRSSIIGEKSIKTTTNQLGDDDDSVYQGELDDLEYFGVKHTRGALLLGSPYMPSTPVAGSSNRYSSSVSGFSSRAGSRPTTPGLSTPSRFGPGTPKLSSKRTYEPKQGTIKGPQQSQPQQRSGMDDFSNYRIEWNWKELLGKKPRHWSAEAGEEYYDPYNALSTHGSMVDSDEDDHILQSSDEDSEEEEQEAIREQQKKFGVEGGISRSSSSGSIRGSGAFATGADNDFTRESEFVIRDGKIARRRSSMVLDRQLL
ncbi:Glycogenin-1 [Linnemannia zychae]|nr:Glycogenin-1 [Linnemannia zychae]